MSRKTKTAVVFISVSIMLAVIICTSSLITFANDYCTVTVEYLYRNGESAYEPYTAVFAKGENVDLTVRNPEILGYTPKNSADDGAQDEFSTKLDYNNISEDHTIKVYYFPDNVHYRVRYFFQNISDDLYTEDNSLSDDHYDKTGLTGSEPAGFDKFEGFTQLFHNEDKIAADGSTVYEVYYDRNYTLVSFNLDGGYGVEPVYAKYNSTFNISEPTKSGYEFAGWALTNENGHFIDNDGNEIDDESAAKSAVKFTTGTVPANDTYYKAVWTAVQTDYTVVYRVQNADDDGYSYAYSVKKNALSGTLISGKDDWSDEDFAENQESGITNEIQKEFLVYNDELTYKNKSIEGDGSTIINVYYDRKEYDLKFYYAWKKDGNYYIPIETRNFSEGTSLNDLQRLYNFKDADQVMVEEMPKIENIEKYERGSSLFSLSGRPEVEFYYIKFTARYGQNISEYWPLEIIEPCIATDNSGSSANPVKIGDVLFFSTWACPTISYWAANKTDPDVGYENNNIATLYERLDKRVLANDPNIRKEQTEVGFAAYWSASTKNNFTRWTQEIYVPVLDEDDTADTIEKDGIKYKKLMDFDLFTTSNSIINVTHPTVQGYSYISNQEQPKLSSFDYEWTDSSGDKQTKHINKPWKTARFFYSRNNYNLILRNGNTRHKDLSVPYETSLKSIIGEAEKDLTYYDSTFAGYYNFDGWYITPDFADSTKYNADTGKMPASGLVLYAKWTPIELNVTFYNSFEYYLKDDEISTVKVEYGDTVITSDIPKTTDGTLTRPVTGARFAGWYYIDNSGNETRFDPSVMPVTSDLKLYAGWRSDVISSYTVGYVKKGTDEEIVDPTNGAAFVATTKTFSAKSGSDLYETGWWPTVPSHSLIIDEDNSNNIYNFEYIAKSSVWYRVRYINSSTGEEMSGYPQEDKNTSSGVVSEQAPHIGGYVVDRVTKSCVLTASAETDADAAKNEELGVNVITFYYTENSSQTVYEVNHYTQNLGDSESYSLYQSQTVKAAYGESVDIESLYLDSLLETGYKVNNSKTTYTGTVRINPETDGYLVIDIYYDRKCYPYVIKYIDSGTNTVLAQFNFPVEPLADGDSLDTHILGNTVKHSAPLKYDYNGKVYDRVSNEIVNINICVEDGSDGNPVDVSSVSRNVINVYYRERSSFTVKYCAVCIPADSETAKDILDNVNISLNQEIVSNASDIYGCSVLSYPKENCEFLGWFDNPDGIGNALTISENIGYANIGDIVESKTYYAVFTTDIKMSTLRIEKYIDSLYYDSKDNPHGFKSGGVASPKNDNDKQGYLNYTNAEQNFLFKIEKYEKTGSNTRGELAGTFYTLIKFDADEKPLEKTVEKEHTTYSYMKYKNIMVDPRYIYVVTELEISDDPEKPAGLAWRYVFKGADISGTFDNKTSVEVVYEDTDIDDGRNVGFYAVRNDSTRDIESDMSSIKNTIVINRD